MNYQRIAFEALFSGVQEEIHLMAVEHGWWDDEREDGTVIALIHSELSEALEALRTGSEESEHIPEYLAIEEEFADVLIRVMDYAGAKNLDLAGALLAKMDFNRERPYRHGKNF